MNKKQLWISLITFILICLTVEIVGSVWTRETVSTWYPTLVKPSWTPPNWLFGPVWSCLYIMIAVSGWMIYKAESSQERSTALILYCFQLGLNFIWSFLFFSMRSPVLGLIDITLLWILIFTTIVMTWRVRTLASVLLIPYFLWVSYAASLNAGIYLLNR